MRVGDRFVQELGKGPQRGLLIVLLASVLVGGMVAQHPVLTVIVVTGLLGVGVGLPWLAKISISEPRSWIGALVLLTMLRPYPAVVDSLIVGRLVDVVWFILGAVILFLSVSLDGKRPVMWGATYWLVATTLSTALSLFMGPILVGQSLVLRDFFELYRGPYYLLILLIASRLRWTDEQLPKYFFRPMLVGIWLVFGVSVLQGLGDQARSVVEYIYTPKSTTQISFEMGVRLRNSGTFGNPNYYAIALAILIPFLLAAYSIASHRRLRFAAGLGSILAFLFLLITGSRTGWVAASISLMGYVFWEMMDRQRKRYSKIRDGSGKFIALIVIVAMAVVIFGGPRLSRVAQILRDIESGGILQVASLEVKYTLGRQRVLKALAESPIVGFGPSKGIDAYLGDNQYSKLFYRYGIVGVVCWLGFWISIYLAALGMRKSARSTSHLVLARALLSVVPAFLVACIGGAFFDATQIATLLLLLIGVGYSSRGGVCQQSTN